MKTKYKALNEQGTYKDIQTKDDKITMATIKEDFVSFETAKLLKEKNCPDFGYSCIYDSEGNKAQTQSIIMKWLREEHNIDVSIIPLRSHKEYLPRIESDIISHDAIPCRKYEEACEAAIKYCLEHLI